jgi:hypothetical protein
VFSGGSGALIYDEGAEAPFALRMLENLGIPRARILLEDRSRNTVENAIFSKALVQPKPGERWLLVTSAHHLPRAIGVFRKMGFPRTIPGRLAHPWSRRVSSVCNLGRWAATKRHRGARMGRACGLLADRAQFGVVSGPGSRGRLTITAADRDRLRPVHQSRARCVRGPTRLCYCVFAQPH